MGEQKASNSSCQALAFDEFGKALAHAGDFS